MLTLKKLDLQVVPDGKRAGASKSHCSHLQATICSRARLPRIFTYVEEWENVWVHMRSLVGYIVLTQRLQGKHRAVRHLKHLGTFPSTTYQISDREWGAESVICLVARMCG